MTTPHIRTATLEGVATIEIARPERKNALTASMYTAMADAIAAAQADGAVRALLITGQPGVFTSGNDIEDFMSRPPGSGSDAEGSPVYRFLLGLARFDKPAVAAVTGAAIGVGTTMLLHCDFVYVSDEARLAMPFVSLGLVPEYASSLLVPQLMARAGRRRSCCWATPSPASRRWNAASPTPCCLRPRCCRTRAGWPRASTSCHLARCVRPSA